MIIKIIICLALGYLTGCFSTGLFIGKIYKVDIRKYGSGNTGMTNALRTLGPKAAIMTFAGDFLKAVIPILLVRFVIFPDADNISLLTLYSGLGTVLGHNYPVWLKFKGGKGISATSGVMAAVDPLIIPFGLTLFIAAIAITKYMSVGSLLLAILFPIWIAIRFPGDIHMLIVALVFMLLAFIRHRSNIKRLLSGTENKIGQKVSTEKSDNNK
jgi:glycerol-3-phosphate acyltransferase PlsY